VRPVLLATVAAILVLIPMSLAMEKGSEANTLVGRAGIGGLLSSLFSSLIVTPALYSLAIREKSRDEPPAEPAWVEGVFNASS